MNQATLKPLRTETCEQQRSASWLDNAAVVVEDVQSQSTPGSRLLDDGQSVRQGEEHVRWFEQCAGELDRTFEAQDRAEAIRMALWKAQSYETLGAWDNALALLQQVIDLCDEARFDSDKAKAYRFMGHIQLRRGCINEALESYDKSLSLTQSCSDTRGEACSYNGLAFFHFERGSIDQAEIFWLKALELATSVQDKKLEASVHNNLGIVANTKGDAAKAITHYNKSIALAKEAQDARELAKIYHNLAKTYSDSERWQAAGEHYELAYQLAKTTGDQQTQADTRLNRSQLYVLIGDLRTAETLCRQSLQTYLRLNNGIGVADAFRQLAAILSARHDWQQAEYYIEKSIKLAVQAENPLVEAEARLEYGRICAATDRTQAAHAQYKLALALFSKLNANRFVELVTVEMAQL